MKQKYVFFLRNDEEKLIHQCFRAGNKQALFWIEAHKYFVQDQTKVGKQIILQANIERDKNAKYGLAIALLCESYDEGIELLLSILNQPNGNNCCKTIDKSFDIQFLEQTHFISQKTKHARKMEWVIGIVNSLTHMEMKNYM